MKLIIAFAVVALAAVALAAPSVGVTEVKEPVKIVSSESKRTLEGGFFNKYESADGSTQEQTGELKEALNEEGEKVKVIVVRGSYTYIDSEGNTESVTYVADENGFKAEGKSIPKVVEARR